MNKNDSGEEPGVKNSNISVMNKRLSHKIIYSPEDIEFLFGIPRGTQANNRSKKIGPPYYKRGKSVFYRRDEFEAWLYSNPVLTKDSTK